MTPAACARCGAFATELSVVAGRSLCRPCVDRLAASTLYSGQAITAVAVLLNPTSAAVMLALNHRRLGSPQARAWGIAAAVIGLVYLGLMQLEIPNAVFLGAGIGAGYSMTRAWNSQWPALEAAGFKRRNPWWVVLATVGVLVALVVIYAVVSTALERPAE
jgi:hypothetical protein